MLRWQVKMGRQITLTFLTARPVFSVERIRDCDEPALSETTVLCIAM